MKLYGKKRCISCIGMLFACGVMSGFDHTFTFDLADFTIVNKQNIVSIQTDNNEYTFDCCSSGEPLFPYYMYSYHTNQSCVLATLSYEQIEKIEVASDIDIETDATCICPNPFSDETAEKNNVGVNIQTDSLYKIYDGSRYGDNRVVLEVSPFSYDKTTRKLYFSRFIRISYDELAITRHNMSSSRLVPEDSIDYLIITQDSLVDIFTELRDWKTMKGVKTEIVSMDSIHSFCHLHPMAAVQPLDIKTFINTCYLNKHVSMVLLGGTTHLVPAQNCILTINYKKYNNGIDSIVCDRTPSDMFYSCLDGTFNWDKNGDCIYGDTCDGVNYHPTIAVSRLPIETREQLSNYIHKLLLYEQAPLTDIDSIPMLMSGNLMYWTDSMTMKSDVHFESDLLFDSYIRNSYDVVSKRFFFDTGNDFGRLGLDSILKADNLSDVINECNPWWLNMACHGQSDRWYLNPNLAYFPADFTADSADALHNSMPMIVTTEACHTSNDQHYAPSLAEALLVKPSGGALVYWGSSNKSFVTKSKSSKIGLSMQFCGDFWLQLDSCQNFGKAIQKVKESYAFRGNSCTNPHGWLLKSMNALGDCEVPIYTDIPHKITNVRMRIAYDAIHFDGGMNGYRTAITSENDNGNSIFCIETDPATVAIGAGAPPCNICLTKTNYVPFFIKTGHYILEEGDYSLFLPNVNVANNQIRYEAPKNVYLSRNSDDIQSEGVVVESEGELSLMSLEAKAIINSKLQCKKGGKFIIY